MTKKNTTPKKRSDANALVPVTEASKALAMIGSVGAAPSKVRATTNTAVVRQAGVVMATGVTYHAKDHTIPNAQVFFVPDDRPDQDGPWLGEADKVAWCDMDTGYECIMLREPSGGYLGGYVGVPETHPLYGFDHQAIPCDLGIAVHGGLSYSNACDDGPSPERSYVVVEARRICHPREMRYLPTRHAGEYRVENPDAWWFGFACNHLYDRIPGDGGNRRGFMAAETEAEYRDDAYVIREIAILAAQLKAISDGESAPARKGPRLPPIGLDLDEEF